MPRTKITGRAGTEAIPFISTPLFSPSFPSLAQAGMR